MQKMSEEYKNPLDDFRSYSVHYVMSASDTTEVLRQLLLHNGKKHLSETMSKKLGQAIDVANNKGKAWLLVDTRRFSQYSITNLDMEHMLGGPPDNPNLPTGLMSLTLIDTTGLTFFPFLTDVMRTKLRVSSLSMFFLLSVVFTGHRYDGTTETVSTCHIPMTLVDFDVDFKSTGSEYKMQFAELEGTNYRDRYSRNRNFLGTVTSVNTRGRGGDTVGALIDDLEDRLNKQSLEYFLKYKNAANEQHASTKNTQVGKLVQYMITVPDTKEFPWRKFKLTRTAKSKTEEPKPGTEPSKAAMRVAAMDANLSLRERQERLKNGYYEKEAQAQQERRAAQEDEERRHNADVEKSKYRQERAKKQDQLDKEEIERLQKQEGKTEAEAKKIVSEVRAKTEDQWKKDDESSRKSEVSIIRDSTGIYSQITFGPQGYIDIAIKDILEASYEFLDLMSDERKKAGTAISHSIVPIITSDETSYVIHFDVVPKIVPREKTEEEKKQHVSAVRAGQSQQQTVGEKEKEKMIVYDYIFTGKNSHIKDLKIHFAQAAVLALNQDINIGPSRLAANAEAGQKKRDVNQVSTGAGKTVEYLPLLQPHDPVMIPIVPKEQQNNNTGDRANETRTVIESREVLRAKQQYAKNIANLHYLCSTQLDVSIRGNPSLCKKFADRDEKGGIPAHTPVISSGEIKQLSSLTDRTGIEVGDSLKKNIQNAKAAYIKEYIQPKIDFATATLAASQDAVLNKKDPNLLMPLVKINIKAPNVDWAGNFLEGAEKYTDEYFNSRPYRLLSIKTTISGADFTQRLVLLASPDNIITGQEPDKKA